MKPFSLRLVLSYVQKLVLKPVGGSVVSLVHHIVYHLCTLWPKQWSLRVVQLLASPWLDLSRGMHVLMGSALKGIVHLQMKILSLFTHTHVVPNLYAFLYHVKLVLDHTDFHYIDNVLWMNHSGSEWRVSRWWATLSFFYPFSFLLIAVKLYMAGLWYGKVSPFNWH